MYRINSSGKIQIISTKASEKLMNGYYAERFRLIFPLQFFQYKKIDIPLFSVYYTVHGLQSCCIVDRDFFALIKP